MAAAEADQPLCSRQKGRETSNACGGQSDCLPWPLSNLTVCNASNHHSFVSLNMDAKAERGERQRNRGIVHNRHGDGQSAG